jgi:SAM-dependent methyltransferase
MISSFVVDDVIEAERIARSGDAEAAFEQLRKIPFADFCELCLAVPAAYPAVRAMIPGMPSADKQKRWVGDHGPTLMTRSCNLVRLFEIISWRVRRRSLGEGAILDYGCGWGRLLRLLYHKTHSDNVFGIDPMRESLEACKESGLTKNIAICDAIPEQLPFPGVTFDFMFAFSVFTHLPESVARAVLAAARRRVSSDGVFVVTVRSREFWEMRRSAWGDAKVDHLISTHETAGYAFMPLATGGLPAEYYGDATYQKERFRRICADCRWSVAGVERDMSEPFQIGVILSPI